VGRGGGSTWGQVRRTDYEGGVEEGKEGKERDGDVKSKRMTGVPRERGSRKKGKRRCGLQSS